MGTVAEVEREQATHGSGSPEAVKGRLEAFAAEVLAEATNRPVQLENGSLYLRGLIEQGPRKSLEPMAERLGGGADYQSLQQFLTDSPWDPARVIRAVAERICPVIEPEAWVLDDTGFPKQGERSPGVKRQYSGTLGKIGNCQIGVSVHAVGSNGTVPLGWALYLPEEWCADPERRRRAKIPEATGFMTKPELGLELIEEAASWKIARVPVLGDAAYGDNTKLRERLAGAGTEYMLSVSKETTAFSEETSFAVPERKGKSGRPRGRLRPDRGPEAIGELIASLPDSDWRSVAFRDGPEGKAAVSRFAFIRVRAAHLYKRGYTEKPREEWLVCEWPEGEAAPTDYWLSNLSEDAEPERLARLARMRWKIELDYRQLKGELGLDHYEGRSWLGWHHHTALVSAAHGFLTLERLDPFHPRPA